MAMSARVRPGELWPSDLAAKDRRLVSRHENLGILGDAVCTTDREKTEFRVRGKMVS
jgi:hypothetical protein